MSGLFNQIYQRGRGTENILRPRQLSPFEQGETPLAQAEGDPFESTAEIDSTPPPIPMPMAARAPAQTDPPAQHALPTPQPASPIPAASASVVPPATPAAVTIASEIGGIADSAPVTAPAVANAPQTSAAPAYPAPRSVRRRAENPSGPQQPSSEPRASQNIDPVSVDTQQTRPDGNPSTSQATPVATPRVEAAIEPQVETSVRQPASPQPASDTDAKPNNRLTESPTQSAHTPAPPQQPIAPPPVAAPLRAAPVQSEAALRHSRKSPEPPAQPRRIEVRIGRVDVTVPPPAAPAATPAPTAQTIGMSLDAFIAESNS